MQPKDPDTIPAKDEAQASRYLKLQLRYLKHYLVRVSPQPSTLPLTPSIPRGNQFPIEVQSFLFRLFNNYSPSGVLDYTGQLPWMHIPGFNNVYPFIVTHSAQKAIEKLRSHTKKKYPHFHLLSTNEFNPVPFKSNVPIECLFFNLENFPFPIPTTATMKKLLTETQASTVIFHARRSSSFTPDRIKLLMGHSASNFTLHQIQMSDWKFFILFQPAIRPHLASVLNLS